MWNILYIHIYISYIHILVPRQLAREGTATPETQNEYKKEEEEEEEEKKKTCFRRPMVCLLSFI
jgi:hypothetical protein